ncbi:MAG TPA: hypothetical protein H9962_08315 [Candidatus Mailhella merdigallinarum]|uniref:Secreted protein n=1 Tax=Candidatus Mailhella merdigallinarum TaxID=2838658 RepID=A0A9D2HES4_9BACT|nr:hypothetical protein [Candidatus Mailhella merdigallinarum]
MGRQRQIVIFVCAFAAGNDIAALFQASQIALRGPQAHLHQAGKVRLAQVPTQKGPQPDHHVQQKQGR